MRFWIDTEFNDFKGHLISMAIVAEDGAEFYESLGCESPSLWVAANVIPVIGIEPVSGNLFRHMLTGFLRRYESVHLIADWPEDIAHFCNALISGPGYRIATPPLTLEIRRDLDGAVSKIPHNALEDALSIRAEHLRLEAE